MLTVKKIPTIVLLVIGEEIMALTVGVKMESGGKALLDTLEMVKR